MRSEPPSGTVPSTTQDVASSFVERTRRAQLVEAAVATVSKNGCRRSSLAEIANRTSIAKSVVIYYFESKASLLIDVTHSVFTTHGKSVLSAASGSRYQLRACDPYAKAHVQYVNVRPSAVSAELEAVVSCRIMYGTPPYLLNDEDDQALHHRILSAGMEYGVFETMSLEVQRGYVENLLDGVILFVRRDKDVDLSELRTRAVPLLIRALAVNHG